MHRQSSILKTERAVTPISPLLQSRQKHQTKNSDLAIYGYVDQDNNDDSGDTAYNFLGFDIKIAGSSSSSSTSIATPHYFNIQEIGCLFNFGRSSGYDTLSVKVRDSATKTDAACGSRYNSTVPNPINGHPPMEWTKCFTENGGDSTFVYRVETWVNDTNWTIGLRS